MIRIPDQDIELGQVIEFDGKQLEATEEFTSGRAYKESSCKYYMTTPKGVIGFIEKGE